MQTLNKFHFSGIINENPMTAKVLALLGLKNVVVEFKPPAIFKTLPKKVNKQ
jgi:hypothetical protein